MTVCRYHSKKEHESMHKSENEKINVCFKPSRSE